MSEFSDLERELIEAVMEWQRASWRTRPDDLYRPGWRGPASEGPSLRVHKLADRLAARRKETELKPGDELHTRVIFRTGK